MIEGDVVSEGCQPDRIENIKAKGLTETSFKKYVSCTSYMEEEQEWQIFIREF
ncbi:MAG: hypothetical protein HFE75_04095 [Firmicutes bacterium]|jgi:hypothetical protein|nr:hypothetical protein [Bacillota bacterium]